MKYILVPIFLFFTSSIYSQILPIQGKLIENGIVVNGNVNFDFEILKNGLSIWTEAQNGIIVTNGLYIVNLGQFDSIPSNVFDNVDFVKLIIKANSQLIDTVDVFSPIESDPTIPDELKDGVDWSEIQNNPDLDQDTTNELQLLSFVNDSLNISDGNAIVIPILSDSINLPDGLSVGTQDTSQNIIIDQSSSSTQVITAIVWQSFILSEDLKLLKIFIKLANINETDIRIRIFQGIGDSSQPIYSPPNIPASEISPLLDFKEITIEPPFILSGGENYTFEITGVTADVFYNINSNNPYLYGISSEGAQNDLLFKIVVEQVGSYMLSITDQSIVLNAPEINLFGRVKDKTGYLTPVGAITAFAGSVIPEGWLFCDGAEVSRTIYKDLYAVLQQSWGEGDGSTTFNVPDLRGRFLRGVDGSANQDPDKDIRNSLFQGGNSGNNVGSYQTDEFKSHTHTTNAAMRGTNYQEPRNVGVGEDGHINNIGTINPSGGTETRPKNVYVNYIIKY